MLAFGLRLCIREYILKEVLTVQAFSIYNRINAFK